MVAILEVTATANHALQRTAPCVTAPASAAAPTMQVPRRTPRSLSLGSLARMMEILCSRTTFSVSRFLILAVLTASVGSAETAWTQLFNGKDFSNWDKYLGPKFGGKEPLGLNNDPLGVFTVVEKDGAPRFGFPDRSLARSPPRRNSATATFGVEYKWGEKKWPPREQPKHYRDTGILYWCIGEHGRGQHCVDAVGRVQHHGAWQSANGGRWRARMWTSKARKVVLGKGAGGAVSRRESGRDVHSLATWRAAVHDGRGDYFAVRSGESRRVERVRSDRVGQRRHSPAQRRGGAGGHESALQRRRAASWR